MYLPIMYLFVCLCTNCFYYRYLFILYCVIGTHLQYFIFYCKINLKCYVINTLYFTYIFLNLHIFCYLFPNIPGKKVGTVSDNLIDLINYCHEI